MHRQACLAAAVMIVGLGLAGLSGSPVLGQDGKAATPRTATTRNISPTLKFDVPEGSAGCQQVRVIESSQHCNGGPARITRGCEPAGGRRTVTCL